MTIAIKLNMTAGALLAFFWSCYCDSEEPDPTRLEVPPC